MLTSDDRNWLRLLVECAVKAIVDATRDEAMPEDAGDEAASAFRENFKTRAAPLWRQQ